MRAVVMRVKHASVTIDGRVNGAIGQGLLILLGVAPTDTPALCDKLAEKALGLRIFCDENGKMNRSLADVGGQPVHALRRLQKGQTPELLRRGRAGACRRAL